MLCKALLSNQFSKYHTYAITNHIHVGMLGKMRLYFEPANRISGNRIHRYALLSVTLATEPMCMHCLVTNDVIQAWVCVYAQMELRNAKKYQHSFRLIS